MVYPAGNPARNPARNPANNTRFRKGRVSQNCRIIRLDVTHNPCRAGVSKITRDMLSDLATEADMQALLSEYNTIMDETEPDTGTPLQTPPDPSLTTAFADIGDLGVSTQSKMNIETLQHQLGISPKMSTFPALNTKRHPDLKNPWDDKAEFEPPSPKLEELALKWHQFAGIHAMVERGLAGKASLLADAVGLGKTAQMIGVMAFMMDQIHRKSNPDPLAPPAPILGECSY